MSEAIYKRLDALEEALYHIEESARFFYKKKSVRAVYLFQKIAFLQSTPFYPAYKLCLSRIMLLRILMLKKETSSQNIPDDLQEKLLIIISMALFLKKYKILKKYIPRVDWTNWHPLESGDAEYVEICQELIRYYPSLARFHRPLN